MKLKLFQTFMMGFGLGFLVGLNGCTSWAHAQAVCAQDLVCPDGSAVVVVFTAETDSYGDTNLVEHYFCGDTEVSVSPDPCPMVMGKI